MCCSVIAKLFMVADDLRDDEIEEFFRKGRIQTALVCQLPQSRNLAGLAGPVSRGHVILGFQSADGLGDFEPLCESVKEHRIKIIDTGPQSGEMLFRLSHFFFPCPRPGNP
jgi:hypothetical protein